MSMFNTFAAAAALAVVGAAVQAAPVTTYSIGASGFIGGGAVTGSFSGVFTPAGLSSPFSAGTAHIVTENVSAFGATLSGNATLPEVSWDLSELQSLRLVEPQPGAPAGTPVALELRALDLVTEIELLLRIAASSEIADALFGPGAFLGARLEDTAGDGDRRLADSVVVEFLGQSDPGTPPGGSVPEPGSAVLALAALLAALLAARLRSALPVNEPTSAPACGRAAWSAR